MKRLRSSDTAIGWFVYFAMFDLNEKHALIKVGISSIPYERLYGVYINCPFTMDIAYFCPVGSKRRALSIEKSVLKEFSDFQTRGEWLKMPKHPEVKKAFSHMLHYFIKGNTGVDPVWKKATGEQIRLAGNEKFKDKLAKAARP